MMRTSQLLSFTPFTACSTTLTTCTTYTTYTTCTASHTIRRRAFHSSKPLLSRGKRDPFEVLGVVRGASKQAIKKAYLEKAKKHHPDQHAGSAASFIELQEAYESLQGIVTMRSTTTSSYSSSTTYEADRVRTRGHGYTASDSDMYSRMNRDAEDQSQRTFHETVQLGHIPLVFVTEWNAEHTVLSLCTHTFKSRSHPNDPAFNNTEKMFAYVQHSKLDNGAPCIDLMWEDGSIIAKCFSQSHAKFHNPKNNSAPSSKSASEAGKLSVAPPGAKMSSSDGKMVVEDADGNLMGYITEENTWFYRGFKIENEEVIRVGRASWSKLSPTIVECEDEFRKKVATALQQETKWIMHLSPLASISQHEVSPLFWIFVAFWVK